MIAVALSMSCCRNPCKDNWWYFFPIAEDLKKQSFKPGTYWIYQDSATGTIDSQSVFYYAAESHAAVDHYDRDSEHCIEYGDIFSMKIASCWNGIPHDTISSSNIGPVINFSEYHIRYVGDRAYNMNVPTDTLTNFHVSGFAFPKVYLAYGSNYQAYSVDNVGVVRWVFDDTVVGRHTWNLLRYYAINP